MKKILLVALGLAVLVFLIFSAPIRDLISGIAPLVGKTPPLPPAGEELPFSVPEGFIATLYSDDVPDARVLTRDPRGALVVSSPAEGSVFALPDEDGDSVADGVYEVIKGLDTPHGLAFMCLPAQTGEGEECALYIAEENSVRKYSYDVATRKAALIEKIADLPAGGGHSTRTLFPHPDGKRLLVSVGSSCNVCEEKDARRASIQAIDLTTKEMRPYATGLRNTVFMAISNVTGDLWGTDMGRDLLGDDTPPDEINIIREGAWYGWPWFYGKNTEDLTFSPNARPSFAKAAEPSHIDIPAHSAPLGIAFIPEEGWPESYWYDALVAYHGSWNRSVPTGYKVVRIPLTAEGESDGTPVDFLSGFTRDGSVLGRPVAILAEPGGTVYVSDDRAGAIYRISQKELPR